MVVQHVKALAARQLGQRGFALLRHPSARRQRMLARHRVDLVLDVGAAGGGYGQDLRAFGYRGTIVSFEPMQAAYERLSAARATDEQWLAHRCALGSTAGTAEINVASNSDSSSLLPMDERHLAAAPTVGYVGTETVEVARLDDVAAVHLESHRRPFLKLDTQGFEKQVLEGGPTTLERCVGLQMELSFVPLYSGGMLVDEAVALAYAAGFHLVGIEPGFADADGQALQADGVFFRDQPTGTEPSGS